MDNKKYKLQVLPLFEEDLSEIVEYIASKLKNPTAANDLVEAIEKAIDSRLPNPKSFEPFQSTKKREHQYYKEFIS